MSVDIIERLQHMQIPGLFFFSSRRRHTRYIGDWSSDVCSSDLARLLAESLVASGRGNGLRTTAVVTAMDAPLGRNVGNALEIVECLETLKGRGPADLESLSVLLAAHMLLMAGSAATLAEAEGKIRVAIRSGAGVEKFRAIIAAQGGD